MTTIPHEKSFDSTLALLSEGYTFTSNRYERLQSDVFETRLMLRKAICAMGEDAAAMFYHPGRFTRKHAMPPTTLTLLQDMGSVQWLDGEAHRQRTREFAAMIDGAAAIGPRNWKGLLLRSRTEDFIHAHRCAGERITIEAVKAAARLLACAIDYEVPAQDLRIDLSRMPAIPESRVIIRKVRPVAAAPPVLGVLTAARHQP